MKCEIRRADGHEKHLFVLPEEKQQIFQVVFLSHAFCDHRQKIASLNKRKMSKWICQRHSLVISDR